MNPRSGVRGVTIGDVANVANNGSSVMRGGFTITPGSRLPGTRPAQTVDDLIKGMTGLRLPTAGKKYSGFPSAAQEELAVVGTIEPFYEIGRYAQQLADAENERLLEKVAKDLVISGPTAAQRSLTNIRQELSGETPGSQAVRTAQENLANVLAQNQVNAARRGIVPAATYTSDKPGFYAPELRGEPTESMREEARLARQAQPGSTFLGDVSSEVMARRALRDAAFSDAMARRNAVAFAGTQLAEMTDPVTGEIRDVMVTSPQAGLGPISMREAAVAQATPGVAREYRDEYGRIVQPNVDLAAEVAGTPRYELARQMATNYFGMSPSVAAATFTPQMDIDYQEMQRDYANAQLLASGINVDASVEDTLLAQDPSGQRLAEYQQLQADEAERRAYEGARNAAEEEMDINIEVATGYSPETAAGDSIALSTARGYLSRPDFVSTIDNMVTGLQGEQAETEADRKVIVQNYAAQYLAENPADPIGAQILLNILLGYTFAVNPAYGL